MWNTFSWWVISVATWKWICWILYERSCRSRPDSMEGQTDDRQIDRLTNQKAGLRTNIHSFNSLAPGGFQINFRYVTFKLTLGNGGWGMSHEIVLRWMPLDLTDDMSTLLLLMAWCCQVTSHYLSQCWPISMSPNGVTRPKWVNFPGQRYRHLLFLIFYDFFYIDIIHLA